MSASGTGVPTGLLGLTTNTALVQASETASAPFQSGWKSGVRSNRRTSTSLICAATSYMEYPGEKTTMLSCPGRQRLRMTMSMISSLPLPSTIRSTGTPLRAESAFLSARWCGSG